MSRTNQSFLVECKRDDVTDPVQLWSGGGLTLTFIENLVTRVNRGVKRGIKGWV